MNYPKYKDEVQTYDEERLDGITLPLSSKEIVDFIFNNLAGKFTVDINNGDSKFNIKSFEDVTITIYLNNLFVPIIDFVIDSNNEKINRRKWNKEWVAIDGVYSMDYQSYKRTKFYPSGSYNQIKVTTHVYRICFTKARSLELFLKSVKETLEA
ncbi:hypothetical protein D3C71_948630 [compost metagenome]